MNRITCVLTLGVVGIITTEFGVVGLLPAISAYYNIGIERAGSLVSMFALVVAVSGPLATLAVSRLDRRKVLQVTLLIFIASNIASVFAVSFGWLLFARVLPAFLLTAYFATGLVIAVESTGKHNSVGAITTIYSGISIAMVICIPLTASLSQRFSWNAAFWLPAMINLLALTGISFIVPAMPGSRRSYSSQMGILKKKVLWLSLASICATAAGSFAVYSYFADYLQKMLSMEETQVSVMLMVFGIAGVLGNWSGGNALKRSRYKSIVCYITAMMLVFISLYSYTPETNLIYKTVLVAAWGFFHMSGFVISQARVNAAAPEAPELASSLVVSIGNSGIALGTALGGVIIHGAGISGIIWGGIGCFSVALLAVLLVNHCLNKIQRD